MYFLTNTKARYGYWLYQQQSLFLLDINFDQILDFGMCNSLIWARVNISIAIVTGKNNGRCDLCVCRSFDNRPPCTLPGRTSSKIELHAFIFFAMFWPFLNQSWTKSYVLGLFFYLLFLFWQERRYNLHWIEWKCAFK